MRRIAVRALETGARDPMMLYPLLTKVKDDVA